MNNVLYTWGDVFKQSFFDLWMGFAYYVPLLIVAVVLFAIGWFVGSLVAQAFERVIASLKVDKLFQSVGADNVVRRAGMNLDTGYFVGQVVKWFIIILFLLPSLDMVFGPMNAVSVFLREAVLGYLPNVLVAAFILVIAGVVSHAVSKLIVASTKAMSLSSANMLGTIAKYAIWIFAFIIALGELGIGEDYMRTLFSGIIGMLALAGALAFGLGGKDAAARFIAKVGEESRG